eukprot:jgi/Galph1/3658/GphlegSOOS_G2355.1
MKIVIDELMIYFPYQYIYPEQYLYMVELKKTLDSRGHCILEMPTGTGKTVTLLSFFVAYRAAHPDVGKLIYCTRTVGEMEKVVEELKKIHKYRQEMQVMTEAKLLAVVLTTRRNLCIHPVVSQYDSREEVDSQCRALTVSWVREAAIQITSRENICSYYENLERQGEFFQLPGGIYSIDSLKEYGKEQGICPYFAARRVLQHAFVVVYNYHYLLDPKVSKMISEELDGQCVIVFDEAHNINDVCIDMMSVSLKKDTVSRCYHNLNHLSGLLQREKEHNAGRLQEEYQRLVRGMSSLPISETDDLSAVPLLPSHVLHEAMPGNIRRAEHFLRFLRRILEFIQQVMRRSVVTQQSTSTFVQSMSTLLQSDLAALQYCSARFQSLAHALKLTRVLEFQPIQTLVDFISILGSYSSGNAFVVIFEPYDERYPSIPDPLLQLACLDASLPMKPIFARFRSVILTSGTISPIEFYSRILKFSPVVAKSLTMSFQRRNICPMIATRGTDQLPLTSKYESREDQTIVRNYGSLVIEMARVVPDGLVCFFTSYIYMERMIQSWHETGVIKKISQYKLIFIETPDFLECTLALENFRKACDCGRGAVFFCVARGKVAEGIDFDGHYGRCVMVIGVPFQYTESRVLRARLEFMRSQLGISETEFLSFDAIRQASQCVGRVVRSKTDYGIMVFADKRFNRPEKKNKLPRWILQFLDDAHSDLSTDMAVSIAASFLKHIAQPFTIQEAMTSSALITEEELKKHIKSMDENSTGTTAAC